MQRRCGTCGGKVVHSFTTVEVQRTISTAHGEQDINPTVRGLGKWRCVNRCKRPVRTIVRFDGAGKECDLKSNGEPKDDVMRSFTKIRQIPVVTALPSKRQLRAEAASASS